jgi:hypothetical protein
MYTVDTARERIDPAEVHDILRNDRRRRVLEQLQRRFAPLSLRELSERIAERETGESPPPRNVRESVYNSLHQTHLPKLDDLDVVAYDKDRKTVQLQEPAREVDVYMEVVSPYGITWAVYYRTLAVMSMVTVVASKVGVPVVSEIPALLWASGFLAVFAISTASQLWSRRWFYLRSLLPDRR